MNVSEQQSRVIEAKEIMTLLPHRYPFLLVDRVLDFKEGEWLKAVKNISVNEPCFTGHFPGEPILPGVLILEALAQAMGILAFKTHELKGGELFYFAGIDEARFKRPVLPGDQMELNVQVIKERRGITAFTGIATVNGEIACEAKLMCARR
nr:MULTISPECIES: 3-hydroxyacyl-ACP dehydratase FabZ [Rodentibacter]